MAKINNIIILEDYYPAVLETPLAKATREYFKKLEEKQKSLLVGLAMLEANKGFELTVVK